MELILLQGAEADIQTAYERLGGPAAGRADLFLQRLDHTLGLMRGHPAIAPLYAGPFRRLVLRGFPLAVFYTVTGERIFIAAVLDLRQEPARLRQRLGLPPV